MNAAAALLHDPSFWKNFFEDLPPFVAVDVEERALAVIAARTGMPLSYVRARMEDYIRVRHIEINGLTHPGSGAIN